MVGTMRFTFSAGDSGTLDNGRIEWRVETGKKKEGDLKILLRIPDWTVVSMNMSALLADFLYQNENVLYPPTEGYLGGEKFHQFLDKAMSEGVLAASDELEQEKRRKRSLDACR